MKISTRLIQLCLASVLSGLFGFFAITPAPASPQAWPAISVTPVITGLNAPVQLIHAGDSSGRLFIVEQAGVIRTWQAGSLLSAPLLDIHDRVLFGGERGLLGLAFPPGFSARRYFYVYYTNKNGDNQVSRFHLNSGSANTADPANEEIILLLPHPTYENHNGGQIVFGPDGYLYIGTGDGGGGGDPFRNAQNPAALLGKILRIDTGDRPAPAPPANPGFHLYLPILARDLPATGYTIPIDNPFRTIPGYRPEIWALGLRNPWRFSFDRSTHDLYIADVGQDQVEEIDFQAAGFAGGANYGWNILEGDQCYGAANCTPPASYVPPVATYPHGAGDANGCSVTGGFVYRGSAYPALQGIYFFADYCKGKIWELQNNGGWQTNLTSTTVTNPTSFGEDQAGELYILSQAGTVYKITNP
jgi:glucose/arabinose dehydrogenase